MVSSTTQVQTPQPSESISGTQLYQHRQPEKEALYRILLHNVETFLGSYPRPPPEPSTSAQTQGADKPKSSGPRFLRKEIRTTMEAYLRCGVHQYGFSRLKCDDCGFERLVPFSCRKRGLCASCHAKTLAHWSEWLLTELLPNVPYRQWVITVPKRIRPFFQYDPNLNKHFSQIVANLLQRWMQTLLGRSILRPLMIVADQSFGTLLNLHPHQHWIISDGAFAMDGSFYPLPRMQKKVREQLTRVLQRKVLNWLVRQGKLSAEERRRMLRWRHTGFSIDTSVRIREDRRQELEKLLCYIRRHPFRLSGFSYNPQQGVVLYHAPKMHGTKKQNFVTFDDPVKALEAMAQLIPHRRKHTVRYYGAAHPFIHQLYSLRAGKHPRIHKMPKHLLRLGRRRWARTLWLVYGVDVLRCKRCKSQLRQLAVITNPDAVVRILKHLGLRGTPLVPLPARDPPDTSTKAPAPDSSQNQDKHQPFDPCLDTLPKDEWYFIDPTFDDE